MKCIRTRKNAGFFEPLAATRSAQAAMMVLQPGQTTGEPQSEHPRCEQWLFVIAGTGKALVNKRRVSLRPQTLLLIEKGEVHQVKNTGRSPLVTINFYAPPAYTADGDVKPAAKR